MTYIKDGLDVSNISFDFSRSVKWYILLTESQIFHTLTVKFGLYLCSEDCSTVQLKCYISQVTNLMQMRRMIDFPRKH